MKGVLISQDKVATGLLHSDTPYLAAYLQVDIMEDRPLRTSELENSAMRTGLEVGAGSSLIRSQLAKINSLARDVKEKDLRISQLQDKAAEIEPLRQENDQLRSQLQLYTQKLEAAEKEVFDKTKALMEAEKSLKPSVQRFQLENEEARIKASGLAEQLRLCKQELENRDSIIIQMRRDMSAKESLLDLKLQESSSLEGQVHSLKSWVSRQQEHVERSSQVMGEKGKFISELELSNAKLREEVEKARKQVKEANDELSFIPKLRHELRQCEFLISTASKELDREKAERLAITQERDSLQAQLDTLQSQLTAKEEQNGMIKGLQSRLSESRETYSQLEFSLSSYEERLKENDQKIRKGKKIMRTFLESLLTWMETYFFSRTSVAMTHIPKAPRTIDGFPELTQLFAKLRATIEVLRTQALEQTTDLEKNYKSLSMTHDKFEHSTSSLKRQIDRLTLQVDQQAELHQALLVEKEQRDRELKQKEERLLACKDEFERMRQELMGIRDEVAVASSNLDYALQECIRGGYVPAKPKGTDLTSIVTEIKQAILLLSRDLKDRAGAAEDLTESSKRDKDTVNRLTEEYGRTIRELDAQVERLTLEADSRDHETAEIYGKYQYCYGELGKEQQRCKGLDQQCRLLTSNFDNMSKLADMLMRMLYPLMVRCQILRLTKHYFIDRNNAYHFAVVECLKAGNKLPGKQLKRLRTVTWAVMFLVRLALKKVPDDIIRYNGLPLKVEKVSIPRQVLQSAAEEQGTNFLYPLIMTMEKALMERGVGTMPKYPATA